MKISAFVTSESGAVTVDYVFWLTATVWSAVSVMALPTSGIETAADRIARDLSDGTIIFTRFDELDDETRVLARETGSGNGPRGNNGWGNGDQDAPGRSGPRNNAENGGGTPPPGLANSAAGG